MDTPVVSSLQVLPDYVIEVGFKDGTRRLVDLKDELYGEVFEPLKDPALFAQAFISPEFHTVAWPNGADLAPEWLYEPYPEKYWKLVNGRI